MDKWEPGEEVRSLIREYGGCIRGYASMELYLKTEFLTESKWWMLGLTVNEHTVIFDPAVKHKLPVDQAYIIYHELTHVAQFRDFGWVGFMGTYLGQWFRSGLSYQKMKERGLEKEAIQQSNDFRARCMGDA
jgi:hypothetical protein